MDSYQELKLRAEAMKKVQRLQEIMTELEWDKTIALYSFGHDEVLENKLDEVLKQLGITFRDGEADY